MYLFGLVYLSVVAICDLYVLFIVFAPPREGSFARDPGGARKHSGQLLHVTSTITRFTNKL